MSRLFDLEHKPNADDWYTPAWIFEGMGVEFDMDVCAPPGGIEWIPATTSLSESDDGITTPWIGQVWCNPPYSSPTQWCRKWAAHSPGGCLLIRADLSTSGPHLALAAAHAMYFADRRLQFVNGQGGPTGSVTFSTVILARGQVCADGLHRLAATRGGTSRQLSAKATA